MKVNRLSLGLQEQLKEASNFNTARSETLFDKKKLGSDKDENLDFSNLDVEDLDITEDKIGKLLGNFTDEVINVLTGHLPGIAPPNETGGQDSNQPAVFTA